MQICLLGFGFLRGFEELNFDKVSANMTRKRLEVLCYQTTSGIIHYGIILFCTSTTGPAYRLQLVKNLFVFVLDFVFLLNLHHKSSIQISILPQFRFGFSFVFLFSFCFFFVYLCFS